MLDVNLMSVAIGVFVGLVLALTGAGGGILAIPLLAFGLNLSMTQAAPIGLIAVMLATSIGALQGLRAGIVRYKAATLVAILGVLFAPFGVWLAHRLPNHWLSVVFAIVLMFVAWRMWQQSMQFALQAEDCQAPACAVNPATSKLFWTAPCTKRLIATGGLAGFLSGLLGVGGGFVIVPTLRKVSNLDMKSIVATSLAIIALVSTSSVVAYVVQRTIDWHIAIPFALAAISGMLLGRLVSRHISNQATQRAFAILAFFVAIGLVLR